MALTDSLMAYYKLDSDANDSLGAYNGTKTGTSSYFTTSDAVIGGCIACAGAESTYYFNNFISGVGGSINLATSSISFGGWVKVPNDNGIVIALGTATGTNQRCYFGGNSSGNWSMGLRQDGYSSDANSSTAVTINEWTHVIVTIEAGSTITASMYINSVLDHTKSIDSFTTYGNMGFSNYVGSEWSPGTDIGYADELGFWNKVLSSTEVSQLYNSGLGTTYNETTSSFLTDELVSYYKFDGDADDAHGSFDCTISGASLTSTAISGSSYDFDGTNDYIYRSAGTLGIGNAFTVNLWVYPDVVNKAQSVFWWGREAASVANMVNIQFGLNAQNTKIGAQVYDETSGRKFYIGNSVFSASTWYMITVTWDGTNLKIYKDATEDTPYFEDTNDSINTDDTDTRRIVIGAYGYNSVLSQYFNGKIDEVGVWNRALSSTEITELYNTGSGFVYPFFTEVEEPSGWTGKILGITNPGKINGLALSVISKVNGI